MRMRWFALTIALAALAVPVSTAVAARHEQEILFVAYGDEPGQVGLIDGEEREHAGPVTFTVDGSDVFLADSVHGRIVKSAPDGRVVPFVSNVGAAALCADGAGGVWAQEDDRIIHLNARGNREVAKNLSTSSKSEPLVKGYGVEFLRAPDGSVEYRTINQKSEKIAAGPKSAGTEPALSYSVKRMNGNEVRILGLTPEGKVLVSVPVVMDGGTAGAVLFKGIDVAGNLYAEVERIEADGAHLEVHRYDRTGKRLALFHLNNSYFTTVYRKTEVASDGSVYQMLTSSDGVHIIRFHEEAKP